MFKTYKLITVVCITAIGLLIGKQATAQTTNSKIPFQGSLYDQGTPVNGANEMVFSIATASWTETHSVQVVNGLYTVVLGSVTPLPANLFTGVDSQQLAITVEGTSIGSVAIYKPFHGDITPQPGQDFQITSPSGKLKADLNFYEPNNAGSLVLYGANDSTKVILGSGSGGYSGFLGLYDSTRNIGVSLRTTNKGRGNLLTYDENHQNVGWFGGYNNGGFYQLIGKDVVGATTGAILSGFWNGNPSFLMEDANAQPGIFYEIQSDGTDNFGVMNFHKSPTAGGSTANTIKVNAGESRVTLFNVSGQENLNLDGRDGSAFFGGHVQFNGGTLVNGTGHFTGDLIVDGNITGNVSGGSPNFTEDITGLADVTLVAGRTTILTGSVDPTNTSFYQIANYSEAQTIDGKNVGAAGVSSANSAEWQIGLLGQSFGDGTGARYAVRGDIQGSSSNYSVSVLGYNQITPPENATVTGVYGRTFNGAVGTQNYGVRARAEGTAGKNIGLFAEALNSVDENWAGWFEGDVMITGNLVSSGSNPFVVDINTVNTDNTAMQSSSTGPGSGETGYGTGSYNVGYRGDALNNNWGNVGLTGYATGTSGVDNAGGSFFSQVDNPSALNKGIYAQANGTNVNYGVYATAFGGVENWAGWFDGDLMVDDGMLKFNNANGNRAAQLFSNANGAGVLYTFNDFGVNTGWFGNQADKGGLWQIIGDDGAGNSTGAILSGFWSGLPAFVMEDANAQPGVVYEMQDDGTDIWSYLNLYKSPSGGDGSASANTVEIHAGDSRITLRSPDGLNEVTIDAYNGISGAPANSNFTNLDISDPSIMGGQGFASINIVNDGGGSDPTGYSGELFLQGTNTPNVQLGGKPWENNNLPYMNLFGSTSDGGGWFHSNVNLSVDTDGTFEAGNIGLQKTDIAGQTAENTITLDGMNGNIGVSGNISSNDLTTGILTNSHINMTNDPNATLTLWNNGDGIFMERIFDGVNPQGGHINVAGTGFVDIDGTTGNIDISGAYLNTSDRRFKKNIETIENALDKTLKLRGVSYTWKDSKKTHKTQIGVIAQEVEEVYPEFVHTKEDGYKSVNYAQMTAVLIEAIKELNAKVEALEGENSELKAELTKVDLLEQKIKNIEKLLNGSKANQSSLTASN